MAKNMTTFLANSSSSSIVDSGWEQNPTKVADSNAPRRWSRAG